MLARQFFADDGANGFGDDTGQIGAKRHKLVFQGRNPLSQVLAQSCHIGANIKKRRLAFCYLAENMTGDTALAFNILLDQRYPPPKISNAEFFAHHDTLCCSPNAYRNLGRFSKP